MTTIEDVLAGRAKYALHHGDCIAWLDTLPDASIDAVVCDPPYAEIDRDYGRMTEAQWWDMMMGVCAEVHYRGAGPGDGSPCGR